MCPPLQPKLLLTEGAPLSLKLLPIEAAPLLPVLLLADCIKLVRMGGLGGKGAGLISTSSSSSSSSLTAEIPRYDVAGPL
jgi:hypothetical protein